MAMNYFDNSITACVISLLVLTWSTVLARCYVRLVMLKIFSWDDWLMVLAILSFTSCAAASQAMAINGVGIPREQMADDAFVLFFKLFFAIEETYTTTLILLKLSIGILLLRVIPNSSHSIHRRIIQIALAANIVIAIYYFFIVLFQCTPIEYFWRIDIPGSCINNSLNMGSMYAAGSVASTVDFVFAVVPILVIWSLRMNRKLKLAVSFILALGVLATVATLIRFVYIQMYVADPSNTICYWGFIIWSLVELALGIIAANLATLQPLYRLLAGKLGCVPTPFQTRSSYSVTLSTDRSGRSAGGGRGQWVKMGRTRDRRKDEEIASTNQDVEEAIPRKSVAEGGVPRDNRFSTPEPGQIRKTFDYSVRHSDLISTPER